MTKRMKSLIIQYIFIVYLTWYSTVLVAGCKFVGGDEGVKKKIPTFRELTV